MSLLNAIPRLLAAAVLCAAAPVHGAFAAPPAPEVTAQSPQAAGPDIEALVARERRRIEAAVAALEPATPGVADVFFVGFAGFGEQGVFRKEAQFARDAFARRFDSGRRSLLLVNDVHDRDTYPLASVTTLRHALELVGRRMDPDEDVLVLLLTSHGGPDIGLEVTNGDLPLAHLQPRVLRKALDDADIRWRLIVASACFSGIFVKPLRTDTTAILTAADSRHSSFGCEDERELTYFGEALLRDALPEAASIEAAFARARAVIREREAAEGLTHSNPQIWIGPKMRPKLAELEAARLARR